MEAKEYANLFSQFADIIDDIENGKPAKELKFPDGKVYRFKPVKNKEKHTDEITKAASKKHGINIVGKTQPRNGAKTGVFSNNKLIINVIGAARHQSNS
ncbi:MAG: hypothetical protein QM613_03725 [Micrococcaceae bacterium]